MIFYLKGLGYGNVVGLPYRYLETSNLTYSDDCFVKPFFKDLLHTLFYFAKWGIRKNGSIANSTICFPIPHNIHSSCLAFVEWLPGGCVIYHKRDLILENYYPLLGKAFCEDLIHSYLLKQKKISLWVADELFCSIEREPTRKSFQELYDEFYARVYLNRIRKIYNSMVMCWSIKNIFL